MDTPRTGHKFTEARSFFLSLSAEADQSSPDFRHYLSAFLNAAYSVVEILELEAKMALKAGADKPGKAKAKFNGWFAEWLAALPEDERTLWDTMEALRGSEVHRLGAETVMATRDTPADPHRLVHYFEIGGKRVQVVDACYQYERLLQRLLSDFHRSPPDAAS
jgi:hypothetical protein